MHFNSLWNVPENVRTSNEMKWPPISSFLNGGKFPAGFLKSFFGQYY
jgi:hypothetical protein